MNKLIITAMLTMMCGSVKAQEVALDTTSVDAKLLTAEGNKMPKYKSGVAHIGRHRARLIRGAHRTSHKSGLFLCRELIRHPAGNLRPLEGYLVRLFFQVIISL